METPEKFELGKYYKHNAGEKLHICGVCESKIYGMCLMGENEYGEFSPIGRHKGATDNWYEISEEEFLSGENSGENITV